MSMRTPKEITPARLECIVMPQGEIICSGRTIGWVKDLGKYLNPADHANECRCPECDPDWNDPRNEEEE